MNGIEQFLTVAGGPRQGGTSLKQDGQSPQEQAFLSELSELETEALQAEVSEPAATLVAAVMIPAQRDALLPDGALDLDIDAQPDFAPAVEPVAVDFAPMLPEAKPGSVLPEVENRAIAQTLGEGPAIALAPQSDKATDPLVQAETPTLEVAHAVSAKEITPSLSPAAALPITVSAPEVPQEQGAAIIKSRVDFNMPPQGTVQAQSLAGAAGVQPLPERQLDTPAGKAAIPSGVISPVHMTGQSLQVSAQVAPQIAPTEPDTVADVEPVAAKVQTTEPFAVKPNLTSQVQIPVSPQSTQVVTPLAEMPIGFAGEADAQSLGVTSLQTSGPLASTTSLQAVAQPVPLPQAQVSQAIALHVEKQRAGLDAGQIEIRLEPEELGKLKITFTPREAGMLVSLTAERPETLDLMRRNSDDFMRDLEGMGLGDAELDFGGSQHNAKDDDATGGNAFAALAADADMPDPQTVQMLIAEDRLDIRL